MSRLSKQRSLLKLIAGAEQSINGGSCQMNVAGRHSHRNCDRYRFGPRERAGLFTFLEMAQAVGELEEVPELRFVHEEVTA